jgi:hypothetical protein
MILKIFCQFFWRKCGVICYFAIFDNKIGFLKTSISSPKIAKIALINDHD